MIKANKIYTDNKISSIMINSEKELFIVFGEENFQLNLNTTELEYYLITYDNKKFELSLKESIEESELVLLYNLKDIDNNLIKGQVLLDSKPTINPEEENKISLNNFKFLKDKLIFELKNSNTPFDDIKNFEIKITKYKINFFEDFSESEQSFNQFILIPKTKKFFLNFNFETNYIYKIEIINLINFEEIKIYEIFNKPDIYFSSYYHLNQILKQIDLDFSLKENFDTKLLIWNESLKLLALMEISIKDLHKITEDIVALFSEYISNKIILNKLVNVFIAQFLPGTDYQINSNVKGKRIGDFQVNQGGESGDSSKIKIISDKINLLEEKIKDSLKFLSYSSVNKEQYKLNRNKILNKKVFIKVR